MDKKNNKIKTNYENNIEKYFNKKTITEKEEQYIVNLFLENSNLKKKYKTLFIKKISTLKPFQKKKIDITNKLAICSQYTDNKCISLNIDKIKYEVYFTKFIRNIASMLVIKNPDCDISKLKITVMKRKMSSIGIIIIANLSDIKLKSKLGSATKFIYDKNNKNIYNIDLPGRQIDQDLDIYVGKYNSKIQAVFIPLLYFFYT